MSMKIVSRFITAGILAFAMPFAALAADTFIPTIDSLTVSDSAVSAVSDYVIAIIVSSDIPAGSTISFFFGEDGETGVAAFTFSEAGEDLYSQEPPGTISGTGSVTNGGTTYEIFTTAIVAAGKHMLTLPNVTNPGTSMVVNMYVTTEAFPPTGVTYSDPFVIGDAVLPSDDGGGDVPSVVSDVTIAQGNTLTSAVSDYVFTITTNAAASAGDDLMLFFQNTGVSGGPGASGYSFANATITSESMSGTVSTVGTDDTMLDITLSSALPADTYEVLVRGVTNSATAGTYTAHANTGGPDAASSAAKSESFTLAADGGPVEGFDDGQVPGKPTALKAKKIKKKSFKARWTAPVDSTVTKYVLQVRKFKIKKKSKWRTFKSVTKTTKLVKKLKPATKYQFRLRAVNDNGKSGFTRWKKFTTKK